MSLTLRKRPIIFVVFSQILSDVVSDENITINDESDKEWLKK
jgi:hypothetical protein